MVSGKHRLAIAAGSCLRRLCELHSYQERLVSSTLVRHQSPRCQHSLERDSALSADTEMSRFYERDKLPKALKRQVFRLFPFRRYFVGLRNSKVSEAASPPVF
jgi:hypothetical protein